MAEAQRDQNFVPTLIAVSSVDGKTPVVVYADPVTHRLLVDLSGAAGTGDVVGPASATDRAIAIFNTATGKLIQNSGVIIAATTNNISGPQQVTVGGNTIASGQVNFSGLTSGTVSIKARDVAGTYTVLLPNAQGGANTTLINDGAGNLSWGSLSASIADGNKGDITTSGSGATWSINAQAVTYAKIQDVTTGKILGRITATNGTIEEIGFSSSFVLSGGNVNLASIADQTFFGNISGLAAAPVALTVAQVKTALALNNVDNTSDANKPISTATQTALNAKQATLSGTGFVKSTAGVISYDTNVYLTSITGTNLDNIFSSNGFLKRTGVGTYSVDTNTYYKSGDSPSFATVTISTSLITPSIEAATNSSINIKSGTYSAIQSYSPAAGGTATLDLSKGNYHRIQMPAGNITIALNNATVGQIFIVDIIQDGVGSRTATWFTTIKWAGGSAPTLTTTASKIDTLGFIITSTGNYQGYVVGQNI